MPPDSHGRWVCNLKGPQPGFLLGRVLVPEGGNPTEIPEGDGAGLMWWRQTPSTFRTMPWHPASWSKAMVGRCLCWYCRSFLVESMNPYLWDHVRIVLTHTSTDAASRARGRSASYAGISSKSKARELKCWTLIQVHAGDEDICVLIAPLPLAAKLTEKDRKLAPGIAS